MNDELFPGAARKIIGGTFDVIQAAAYLAAVTAAASGGKRGYDMLINYFDGRGLAEVGGSAVGLVVGSVVAAASFYVGNFSGELARDVNEALRDDDAPIGPDQEQI